MSSQNLCYNFFYMKFQKLKFLERGKNPEEHHCTILEVGSQYFWRYDLWKLGLFQALEFHLKEVIMGKSS